MRGLKFRAWDVIDHRWCSSHEVATMLYEITINPQTDVASPDNHIFSQFTGLLDKNGKEIYEGDIVSVTESMVEAFVWVKSAAGFKTKRLTLQTGVLGSVLSDPLPDWPHYEVIGNIYEEGGPHA